MIKRLIYIASVAVLLVSCGGKEAAPVQMSQEHPRLIAVPGQFESLRKRIAKADFEPLVQMHRKEMRAAEKYAADTSRIGHFFDAAGKRLRSANVAASTGMPCLYAYMMTGEQKYFSKVMSIVEEVCSYPDWNPSHFLDAAKASLVCSFAYDWLYDRLTQQQRDMILDNLKEKLILPASEPEYAFMLKKFNNWNQTCNGALILASIALHDREPELAGRTIKEAIERNMPAFEPMSAPDGIYPEGAMYMWAGMSWQILIFSALESAYGTDFGLSDVPGFDKAGMYRLFSYGNVDELFDFSDNTHKNKFFGTDLSFPLMWYFADRYSDNSLLYKEVELMSRPVDIENETPPGELYPMCILLASRYDGGKIKAPEQKVFSGGGPQPLVMARTGWDRKDLYLGVKGGNPTLDHAHMDVGSFVFDAYGYRWAADMGYNAYSYYESRLPSSRGLWDKREHSPRWKLYLYNNRFHNTITINDEDHAVTGYAPLVKVYDEDSAMGGTFDLNNAFKGNTMRALRTVLIRDGKYLEVTDDILTSEEAGCDVRWNMATKAQVQIVEDGILLSQGGITMKLTAEGADVQWYAAPADASKDGYAEWDYTPEGFNMCGYTCRMEKNDRFVITCKLERHE